MYCLARARWLSAVQLASAGPGDAVPRCAFPPRSSTGACSFGRAIVWPRPPRGHCSARRRRCVVPRWLVSCCSRGSPVRLVFCDWRCQWFVVLLVPVNEVVSMMEVLTHPAPHVSVPKGLLNNPINIDLRPLGVVLVFRNSLVEELVQSHVDLPTKSFGLNPMVI